jgi:hypothetical protein
MMAEELPEEGEMAEKLSVDIHGVGFRSLKQPKI